MLIIYGTGPLTEAVEAFMLPSGNELLNAYAGDQDVCYLCPVVTNETFGFHDVLSSAVWARATAIWNDACNLIRVRQAMRQAIAERIDLPGKVLMVCMVTTAELQTESVKDLVENTFHRLVDIILGEGRGDRSEGEGEGHIWITVSDT